MGWVGRYCVFISFELIIKLPYDSLRSQTQLHSSLGGRQLGEWMNGQRKGYGRHMGIARNLMLDTKLLFFFLSSRSQTPKSALILEPKPKARPTESTGCEKDIFFKKLVIGNSHSLGNYLSSESLDTIFNFRNKNLDPEILFCHSVMLIVWGVFLFCFFLS